MHGAESEEGAGQVADAGPVVIGLDLGTTSAKAIAYDLRGRPLGEADREYRLHAPLPGRAEQDPEEVREAALDVLATVARGVDGKGARVAAVSLSAAMHSILAVAEDGSPRSPAVTFADSRAQAQVQRLRTSGGLEVYRRTGTPLHPMTPLAKLAWFAEHEPQTAAAAHRWVSLKEFLTATLLGEWVVDHSIASATGLFALETCDWDDDALAFAQVRREQLSALAPTTEARPLASDVADRLGLPRGTPLVLGAADGCLANLGAGAVAPDVAAVTIATSGAARVTATTPRTDPQGRLFCYVLTGDRWVVGGPISNGGLVLKWLRDQLLPEVAAAAQAEGLDPYDVLVERGTATPPGAEGLLFLPYLVAERAPLWDATPRGVLFGLDVRHTAGHVVRAGMEGALLQLRWVLDAMADIGIDPGAVHANGGATRSTAWLQLMADVLGRPIGVPEQGEATCLGAALLGALALDLVPSLDRAAEAVAIARTVEPAPGAAGTYTPLFDRYRQLYEALGEPFAALGRRREGQER